MKKKLLLVFQILATVLELLPYGAVLEFANPEGEPIRKTYSYFSLIPYGYANFAPFITALLTCTLLVLTVVYLANSKKSLLNAIKLVSILAFLLSLAPLLYGLNFFSIVGLLISVVLLLNTLLAFLIKANV